MGLRYRTDVGEVEIVGDSRPMQMVYRGIEIISGTRYPVLLRGETGTGKNLVAGAIHYGNGGGPYVPVNCTAIPDTLIEGELFGHRKGAYTGADSDRRGRIAEASGGSVFLDEIGSMPRRLQPKLLRVLEEGKVWPLGGGAPVDIDVRFISATNAMLEEQVGLGEFREDLYQRLKVLELSVPPLRDRPEDVRALAEHFLRKFNEDNGRNRALNEDCYRTLESYRWPGNVRQLENAVIRAALFAGEDLILPNDFGFLKGEKTEVPRQAMILTMDHLAESRLKWDRIEKEYMLAVFRRCDGNVVLAAGELGVGKSTLYRRLKDWGISIGDDVVVY